MMADPEADRCRRTDGKKWRCYKSVVNGQKYCERHMHRGRQRSRKLVEGFEIEPISASANTCSAVKLCDVVKASIITNSEHATSGSGKKVKFNSHTELNNNSQYCKCKGIHDRVDVYNPSSCYSTSASIKAAITRGVEQNGLQSYDCKQVTSTTNHHFKEDCSYLANPAYGFSQKSLLQYSPEKNDEAMRCKRSDGKQWRCSHEVVDGQKYCEKHMHRGKKVTEISNPPILACSDNPYFIAKRSNSRINPTIVACAITVNDVNQSTSSSSDATTISD